MADRRPFGPTLSQAMTWTAAALDHEGSRLLAAGSWGKGLAYQNAASLVRKLRTMGAAEDFTKDTAPTLAGADAAGPTT